MMSNASSSASGGIGLGGMVFIVFLVLKLLGKIDWSWWWVTSPLWIPAVIVLGLAGVLLIVAWIISLFQ